MDNDITWALEIMRDLDRWQTRFTNQHLERVLSDSGKALSFMSLKTLIINTLV